MPRTAPAKESSVHVLMSSEAPKTPKEFEALRKAVYKEVGWKGLRARGRWCFLKTMPVQSLTRSGLIWLPPKVAQFHNAGISRQTAGGVVLEAGPDAKLTPGDFVLYPRMMFAWYKKLPDGTLFGWIDRQQILCRGEPDVSFEA